MEDSVGDLDPAINFCQTVAEWVEASSGHPDALDGVDPRIFLRNRCDSGGKTGALCDEILGR